MKKLFLLTLSLLTVGFAAGCGSSNKDGYTDKDDKFQTFEFVKTLTDDEKKVVVEAVTKSIQKLSGIEGKGESVTDTDNTKASRTVETTVTYYQDTSHSSNYIAYTVTKQTEKNESNGIILNADFVSAANKWDTGTGFIATRTDRTEREETKTKVDCVKFSESSKEKKKSLMEEALRNVNNTTGYEDKDGNTFLVKSEKKKTVNPVQYGEGTKDHITFTYTQEIYKIAESKITDITIYNRTKTNRDPQTNDWYNEIKITSSSFEEYHYVYNALESGNIKNLNTSIKDYVTFEELNAYFYQGNATGESVSDITINPSSNKNSISYTVAEDNDKNRVIEFTLRFDKRSKEESSSIYTFDNAKLQIVATTRKGASDPETNTHEIDPRDALDKVAGLDEFIKVQKLDESGDTRYYMINKSDDDIELTFNIKITASSYTINSIEYEVIE